MSAVVGGGSSMRRFGRGGGGVGGGRRRLWRCLLRGRTRLLLGRLFLFVFVVRFGILEMGMGGLTCEVIFVHGAV